ncbi:hypothetical protein [Bosea beijingensis]|nr:hypothetical protein [Bosea sp. REN20]
MASATGFFYCPHAGVFTGAGMKKPAAKAAGFGMMSIVRSATGATSISP